MCTDPFAAIAFRHLCGWSRGNRLANSHGNGHDLCKIAGLETFIQMRMGLESSTLESASRRHWCSVVSSIAGWFGIGEPPTPSIGARDDDICVWIGRAVILLFLFGSVVAAPAQEVSNQSAQSGASGAEGVSARPAQPNVPEPSAPEHSTEVPGRSTTDAICEAIAAAAARNKLPLAYLIRLIWQESRFDPTAISSKGARGVAQFMPNTATWRGLNNPFDPVEAIPEAARLLSDLRQEFGNLGLAAAAYHAGPHRVRQWLAGRQGLPRETQNYVRVVTGQPAEKWMASTAATATLETWPDILCPPGALATAPASRPTAPPAPEPHFAWGVQLLGSPSRVAAMSSWSELQRKYRALLSDQRALVVETKLSGAASWYRVRIGANRLESANALCARLRDLGASCLVQRN
jgi:hypothetical protein